MIQSLRYQATSGNIDDLAHVTTGNCLSDCLTKRNVKADNLVTAVKTSILKGADCHPAFRTLLRHKAYMAAWICQNLKHAGDTINFLGEPIRKHIHAYLARGYDTSESSETENEWRRCD